MFCGKGPLSKSLKKPLGMAIVQPAPLVPLMAQVTETHLFVEIFAN